MRTDAARRLVCCAAALIVCCAPAAAAHPRIIGGHPSDPGEYPAQGWLQIHAASGSFVCGGSLVGNRRFLTAGHCATEPDTTTPLPPSAFTVSLGQVNRSSFGPGDRYAVVENEVDADFGYESPGAPDHDVALLTLARPAPAALEPIRLVEAGKADLWAADQTATIVGWGTTERGGLSDALLETTVPMQSDARCAQAWGASFDASAMVCAGGGATDACGGDSGGPLMVGDGAFLVLAGLTSWGADPCALPNVPGVYTRLGDPALNRWVRDRVPLARASVSDPSVERGQRVTFSVAANHPGIPGYFTSFAWDFDSDGSPDARGASAAHAYEVAGDYVARVVASGAGEDTATDKVEVHVLDPAATPPPAPALAVPAPQAPVPVPRPMPGGPLAAILGRPLLQHGRVSLRVRFSTRAPAGTAVVELLRGRRTIGVGRVRVPRGGTRRVRVTLTRVGRRLLRRPGARLTVRAQVRVNHRVLRVRTLTLRR